MAKELSVDLAATYNPPPSEGASFMISAAIKVVVGSDGKAKLVLDADQVDHIQRCISMSLGLPS